VTRQPLSITALDLARRFLGLEEAEGIASNPQVLAMLKLDASWVERDEVAWCSAFTNYVAWLLNLPRSRSLAARSWLGVGSAVDPMRMEPGFDVVVLRRGPNPALGHVGFFAGYHLSDPERFYLLGGNQNDMVSVAEFRRAEIVGVRRI
jgi:uncharacterized protein (TIGR02594 family)